MNHKNLVNEIINRATIVMHEMSDMMEGYEMEDYAEKCQILDDLWFAIDNYLKEVKDDDEMEDLGLS